MARHRWCNSAAAGIALRAIEGATVLQQVMREKGKLEEAMHCAQNDHRPCLVDAAREVGRNTQMTSNSMHRLFCNNLLPRSNEHFQAMDGANQGWRAPPRFFAATTRFPAKLAFTTNGRCQPRCAISHQMRVGPCPLRIRQRYREN